MGLFGNKDIIPDDIAEKIAQKLFERLNLNLERHIDEDIKRYDFYDDLKMKPQWHYCSGDMHFTFRTDKKITEEMEFYNLFLKGNGYLSLDRFNCVHAVNEESFTKVLDLVRARFATEDKAFVYRIFYDKVYKSKCFIPYAYITLDQKLMRGEGKGHSKCCRFPKPDRRSFHLWKNPYDIVQDLPDLRADAGLNGITLLSEQEVKSCMRLIPFRQKEKSWWLKDSVPNLMYPKIMQPNELVCPTAVEFNYGISPAVTGDLKGFKRGDKLLFAGHKWTVISRNMMFIDDLLGTGPFKYYRSDNRHGYEVSDIKVFIENWFAEHRGDPVYRG